MKVFWTVGNKLEMDEPLDSSDSITDDDRTDDNGNDEPYLKSKMTIDKQGHSNSEIEESTRMMEVQTSLDINEIQDISEVKFHFEKLRKEKRQMQETVCRYIKLDSYSFGSSFSDSTSTFNATSSEFIL